LTDTQLVDYASAVALELRQPSAGGEPVIRLNFKNGSDPSFTTYNFLNRTGDVPLSAFIDAMAVSEGSCIWFCITLIVPSSAGRGEYDGRLVYYLCQH
jgi:hypothetical protein